MKKKERYKLFVDYFKKAIPNPKTELKFNSPFELLVAVVLSAQCTDVRVNKTTPHLFNKYPDAKKLSRAYFNEVFNIIKSISYPNNKSKHLIGLAKKITTKHKGKIPNSFAELESLPGVGRKTANVILSVLYKKPTMAVDTHVNRVSKRIGLVNSNKNLKEVEFDLIKNFDKADIPKAHHWLILHGRYICLAKKPKCEVCKITKFCKYFKEAYR
jgi:endonuclease-3